MRPKALIVGIHHWRSPMHVGSHAIAGALADKGWEVAYVSAPITPFHWLRAGTPDFNERLKVWRSDGAVDPVSGIWHYVPFAFVAPDNRPPLNSSCVFNHWQELSYPNVIGAVQRRGFGEVQLLLMNSHFQPFWLDAIRSDYSVYRMADLNAGFSGHNSTARLVESNLARSVDLVVTSAYTLLGPARAMGARDVFAMPNGVTTLDFEQRTQKPTEYMTMDGSIAVYVGALEPWFDTKLIDRCAAQLPHIHFVLIGPMQNLIKKWHPPANVHLLGSRQRDELPAYLQHADVGLMPFDQENFPELVDHIHPLKLYEYMMCELPVVSTNWAELRAFDHPAILCESADQFVAGVLTAIKESRAQRAAVKAFAVKSDWSGRVGGLLNRLNL